MAVSIGRSGLYGAALLAWAVAAGCSSDQGNTPAPTTVGGSGGAAGNGTTTMAGTGAAGRGTAAAGSGGGSAGRAAVPTGGGAAPGAGGAPPPAGGSGAAGMDAGMMPASMGPGASVFEYHGNAKRDGHYKDAAFTRAAAAGLKMASMLTVNGAVFAQPLFYEGGGPGGVDLVISATEENEITAFNAADGAMVWRKMLGAPQGGGLPCGNITPLGVTGTPVIDPKTRTMYVAAMTTGPSHKIYALSIDTGDVVQGWPVEVEGMSAGGQTFDSSVQNQRGALVIVGNMVYVPYGGHFGDCGAYRGWVVGVPLDKPSAPVAFVTNALASGVWAPGGLASDGTSVFAATGNSMASASAGPIPSFSSPSSWGHGNAILKLSQQLTTITESQTADFFAPQDWAAKDSSDLDLGGSGPILFSVAGAKPSELVMALGKSGDAYLLSAASLGGMGGEIEGKVVSGGGFSGGMIQAAAAYPTMGGTFVAFRSAQPMQGCGTGSGYLGGIKVSAGSPPTMSLAWCAGPTASGSPIVTTTDGMSDSVVWHTSGNTVRGFNGETGEEIFGGGVMLGQIAAFSTPMVAKGKMYIAAAGRINVLSP